MEALMPLVPLPRPSEEETLNCTIVSNEGYSSPCAEDRDVHHAGRFSDQAHMSEQLLAQLKLQQHEGFDVLQSLLDRSLARQEQVLERYLGCLQETRREPPPPSPSPNPGNFALPNALCLTPASVGAGFTMSGEDVSAAWMMGGAAKDNDDGPPRRPFRIPTSGSGATNKVALTIQQSGARAIAKRLTSSPRGTFEERSPGPSEDMTLGVKQLPGDSEEQRSSDQEEQRLPVPQLRPCETRERFSQFDATQRARTLALGSTDMDQVTAQQEERPLAIFVKGIKFEAIAASLLTSNIIMIGLQVEYRAHSETQDVPILFKMVNAFFCFLFSVELALRVLAHGYDFFFKGDYMWSWFDLIVVLMQIMETAVTFSQQGDGEALRRVAVVGRVVRVARIIRIIRIIRVMRFVRPFKVLITAIYGTMKACCWTIMLLLIIMYVFGMIFAQATSDFLLEKDPDSLNGEFSRLRFYYGSLPRTIFTLYKAILGGVDWEDVIDPLVDVGWTNVMFFLVYVSFIYMVVMNVVAGLFLQSAIEQAQQDQEHAISLRLAEKQSFIERLEMLFRKLDTSNDGFISLCEFESHLKDEHMQAFLASFGIETADAWTLFKLLDTDGGGSVDYNEFVEGCIRLKGNAKSIQMAQLMYHHKWIMDKVCEIADLVQELVNRPGGAESISRGLRA